jgi:hypothetical protein
MGNNSCWCLNPHRINSKRIILGVDFSIIQKNNKINLLASLEKQIIIVLFASQVLNNTQNK